MYTTVPQAPQTPRVRKLQKCLQDQREASTPHQVQGQGTLQQCPQTCHRSLLACCEPNTRLTRWTCLHLQLAGCEHPKPSKPRKASAQGCQPDAKQRLQRTSTKSSAHHNPLCHSAKRRSSNHQLRQQPLWQCHPSPRQAEKGTCQEHRREQHTKPEQNNQGMKVCSATPAERHGKRDRKQPMLPGTSCYRTQTNHHYHHHYENRTPLSSKARSSKVKRRRVSSQDWWYSAARRRSATNTAGTATRAGAVQTTKSRTKKTKHQQMNQVSATF